MRLPISHRSTKVAVRISALVALTVTAAWAIVSLHASVVVLHSNVLRPGPPLESAPQEEGTRRDAISADAVEPARLCRGRFRSAPPRAVVHFHIPRSAGSALEQKLLQPLATRRGYRVFHHNDRAEHVFSQVPEADLAHLDLLTGRQHWGMHALLRDGAGYVTVMRDPVQRVLSLYRYVRGSPQHHRHTRAINMTLGEFTVWAADETANWVTRALCAPRDERVPGWTIAVVAACRKNATFAVERAKAHLARDFAVVGLHEHYTASVALVKRCLGVTDREVGADATAVYGESQGKVTRSTAADIATIRAANSMDMEVYRFAVELFERHRAQLQHAHTAAALVERGRTLRLPTFPMLRVAHSPGFHVQCDVTMSQLIASATTVVGDPRARDLRGAGVVMGPDVSDARLRVTGTARKGKNGAILGATGFAINRGAHEYRITRVEWRLEYERAPLRADEAVESDVCLVVLDDRLVNSVSSGEEIVCVHEHYVGGATPDTAEENGATVWTFGEGGLPLRPGFRVEVGSVSSVWAPGGGSLIMPDEVELRAPAGEADRFGLGIAFNITLVRSDTLASADALTSVRSPLRDRVRTGFPGFASPATVYKNVGSTPVALDSLAVFLSVLTPAHPLEAHVIEIEIDHETVRSFCAPPHQARKRSESSSTLVPLRGLELAPGSSISATHLHLGTATINIDIALYIVSDARPGALLPTDVSVLPGRVDINADSYPDLVDVDQAGDVWTDLTRGDQNGAHDTQHSLIFGTTLPAVMLETMRPEAWTLPGETSSSSSYLHFESELGCLNFEMRRKPGLANFGLDLRYCNESLVPRPAHECAASDCVRKNAEGGAVANKVPRDVAYADMDGDGFLDRVRADQSANGDVRFLIARGGVQGLEREHLWFVSTCCRASDDDREGSPTFVEASRIITKRPRGTNASVALLDLGYCRALMQRRVRRLGNEQHTEEHSSPAEIAARVLQPWCAASLEIDWAWLHFQFGVSPSG